MKEGEIEGKNGELKERKKRKVFERRKTGNR